MISLWVTIRFQEWKVNKDVIAAVKLWDVFFEAMPQTFLAISYLRMTPEVTPLPVMSIIFSIVMMVIGLYGGCKAMKNRGVDALCWDIEGQGNS